MTIHPIRIDSAGGEYMESVVIIDWTVALGQEVKKGDIIVTVETAKAATEIEAEHDGFLAEIFFDVGQEAPIKAILGTITDTQTEAGTPAKTEMKQLGQISDSIESHSALMVREQHLAIKPVVATKGKRIIASPLARRLARESGIDLAQISGTGPHGRIKARDLAAIIAQTNAPAAIKEQKSPLLSLPNIQNRKSLPLVLLHGFGADRSSWRQILPLLPTSIETITLDLPGHGTQAATTATHFAELVFSISDQLEQSGQKQVHLVGHSLGGAVALALSSLGRISIHSLTLLAPAGFGTNIHTGFVKGLVEAQSPEELEVWLRQMVGDAYSLPQNYAQAVFRQMDKIGNRAILARMAGALFPHGAQIFNLYPDLAALSIPTRMIWGRDDRILSPPNQERLPDFVAFHCLTHIGHVPQLEAPALTARLIGETVLSAG